METHFESIVTPFKPLANRGQHGDCGTCDEEGEDKEERFFESHFDHFRLSLTRISICCGF